MVATTWGSTGDVNGDAYSDLIAGTPFLPMPAARVQVYAGSALGVRPTAVTIPAPDPGATFGLSVAQVGDVNGDGYGDLAVGGPAYSENAGRVYVFHGGPTGLGDVPARVLTASLGPEANFGAAIAGCDVDRDGYSDVIVGAYGAGSSAGNMQVFSGGPSGVAATARVTLAGAPGSRFGISVACAGDLNADGYADVAVGADAAMGLAGRVYVFHGRNEGLDGTPTVTLVTMEAGQFGLSVGALGDVNGDGHLDLIAGAPRAERAYVFLGSSIGLSSRPSSTLVNPGGFGDFGQVAAGVGDVNGDGFNDVVVGAPQRATFTGTAWFYLGSTTGLGDTPVSLPGADAPNFFFGGSVSGPRDYDADGFADFAVGAERALSFRGRLSLFYGGSSGISRSQTIDSPDGVSGRFAYSIAMLGRPPPRPLPRLQRGG